GPKIGLLFEHPTETGRRGKTPVAAATSKRPRQADWESTETAETMRTRAAGSSHENCCFMGQFRKFMTIQPIFDATARNCCNYKTRCPRALSRHHGVRATSRCPRLPRPYPFAPFSPAHRR